MVDTRPRAREKALKRAAELKAQRDALRENNPAQTERPPSAGFESERQRAKNALKDELGTYDGTGVHKITASAEQRQEERVLNVAAYCRVSTDDIEQTVSIEMQKRNYRDTIRNHPGWRFAGLYVEMLTPSMIQMHPACVQTALKMHTAPQAVCICRIFGVFSGCILEIKVHPPKIHVHIAQKKRCAGVRSQAVKSRKENFAITSERRLKSFLIFCTM